MSIGLQSFQDPALLPDDPKEVCRICGGPDPKLSSDFLCRYCQEQEAIANFDQQKKEVPDAA